MKQYEVTYTCIESKMICDMTVEIDENSQDIELDLWEAVYKNDFFVGKITHYREVSND